MRYIFAIGKILILVLAVWLQTGVAHADSVDFGSVDIGPSLKGTSDCESLASNAGNPKTVTVSAVNNSGVNWDDFTIVILTCSGGATTPGNGVSFAMTPRPTDSIAGGAAMPVHNFTESSQSLNTNSEHFTMNPVVGHGQAVSLTLPVNWGFTTSNFELQLTASTPTPEPASVELLGLGLIGIVGSVWQKARRS